MNKNEKPIWMYSAVLAILIAPTLFIAGIVVGSSAGISSDKAWDTIFITLSAISTAFIAFLTTILAVETWRLRRNQDAQIDANRKEAIRPQIEVFLESSIVGFQFIMLEVENIGKGIAKNINFEITNSIDELSPSEKEIIQRLRTLSFFKNSLSILGVNKSKKSFLFSFIEMTEKYSSDFFKTELTLLITYEDIEENKYSTLSKIDLSEFEGITELGKGNPTYRMSVELEKIRESLEKNISNKRLRVDSYTQGDRDLENKMRQKRLDEHFAKKEIEKSLITNNYKHDLEIQNWHFRSNDGKSFAKPPYKTLFLIN